MFKLGINTEGVFSVSPDLFAMFPSSFGWFNLGDRFLYQKLPNGGSGRGMNCLLEKFLSYLLSEHPSPPAFYDFKRVGEKFLSEGSANVEGTQGRPAPLTGATSCFPSELMENLSN